MSDNNRIITPGGLLGAQPKEAVVNISVTSVDGRVRIEFNPAITRAQFTPQAARELAIHILMHAEKAQHPQPVPPLNIEKIEIQDPPPESQPPTDPQS